MTKHTNSPAAKENTATDPNPKPNALPSEDAAPGRGRTLSLTDATTVKTGISGAASRKEQPDTLTNEN